MSAVHSRNTGPERRFLSILGKAGIKGFVRNPDGIVGNPDIAFKRERIAIFIDSTFWHGRPKHLRRPNSSKDYWQHKIDSNVKRDKRNRAARRRAGWSVLRVWEHELKAPDAVLRRTYRTLMTRRSTQRISS